MVSLRPLDEKDLVPLQVALDVNLLHSGEKAALFVLPNVASEVVEDEQGPMGYMRFSKTLRVMFRWVDNEDRARNAKSLFGVFQHVVELAKNSGFTEIVFQTSNPKLAAFCQKNFGFVESAGEQVLYVKSEG